MRARTRAREFDSERLRVAAAAVRRAAPAAPERRDHLAGPRPVITQERRELDARLDLRAAETRRVNRESMRDRVNRARAESVLARVRTSGWWDNATAGDLEQARAIANAPGTPSVNRSAIRGEMESVAQRRYGGSVDGAIRYERENPNQPPPDIRARSAAPPAPARAAEADPVRSSPAAPSAGMTRSL
ncbi:MAG: hypothetical protein ACTHZJ_05475 [Brevibacterium yomogidense]